MTTQDIIVNGNSVSAVRHMLNFLIGITGPRYDTHPSTIHSKVIYYEKAPDRRNYELKEDVRIAVRTLYSFFEPGCVSGITSYYPTHNQAEKDMLKVQIQKHGLVVEELEKLKKTLDSLFPEKK